MLSILLPTLHKHNNTAIILNVIMLSATFFVVMLSLVAPYGVIKALSRDALMFNLPPKKFYKFEPRILTRYPARILFFATQGKA